MRGMLGFAAIAAGTAVMMPGVAAAAPKPTVQRPFLLVIDPGHGGDNSGCSSIAGDVLEKDITLLLAQSVAAQLVLRMPHAKVLLTRDGDRTLTLADRVRFANEQHADLFLSIHANASPTKEQSGFETFVVDAKAGALATASHGQLAQGESGAEEGAQANNMLRALAMQASRSKALTFASAIQQHHAKLFPGRNNRGVREGNFDVLLGAQMPAVLTEVGFLDHAEESKILTSSDGRQRITQAIVAAVLDYYGGVHLRA